jgi:hypothetical protein
MATVNWQRPGTSGKWSVSSDWNGLIGESYPGQTVTDAVTLGGAPNSYVVTDDVASASIASLTFTVGNKKATTTLLMAAGNTLSVSGNVSLPSIGIIQGAGTLSAVGTIGGGGTIEAGTSSSAGTLVLTGAGGLATGANAPVLRIGTAAPSVLNMAFAGSVTANPVTINNANQTLQLSAGILTINGTQNITNGTLRMAGATLVDAKAVTLGSGKASGNLIGFGTVSSNISVTGSGTADIVLALGGLLDVRGTIGSGVVLAIDSSAPADLKIDNAAVAVNAIRINSANQTLEIGATGNLTIQPAESYTNGTIQLDGGTLTDSNGVTVGNGATLQGSGVAGNITLAGGTLVQNGGVLSLASVSGFGVIGGTPSVSGTTTASGGVLEILGAFSGALAIDTVAGSDLKLDGTLSTGALAINSANQTLEIGASAALTITAAEAITNGRLVLDGGTLIDTSGITLGSSATLAGQGTAGDIVLSGGAVTQTGGALNLSSITGFGVVNGSPTVSGALTASGGVLDLAGNVTSTGTAYKIGTAAGSVLELGGTAAAGTTFTFAGPSGQLELADVAGGVVQQFNGTIAGLGAGNSVNIQAAVTSASLSGNTITVLNDATTVATLQLSGTPAAGTVATAVADSTLGGYDVSLSNSGTTTTGAAPKWSHILVVVEENQAYSNIIGNTTNAPYINNTLAAGGALLTNYHAITYPSEPNYFSLYAGSTFGVTDDNYHAEPDPTLATILKGAGDSFTGYVEVPNSDQNHDPWFYFPEGTSVETDFSLNGFNSQFGSGNFSSLPTVSFVIPNVDNDMHNGTVAQGDTWLQTNINAYAQWALANNSLLAVTWDENDGSAGNQVPAILYGAGVTPGTYSTLYDHYNLLSTLLGTYGLTGPNNAANAAQIQVSGGGGSPGGGANSGRTISTSVTGPIVLSAADNPLTITSTGTVASAGDAIDAPSGTTWTITNSGTVTTSSTTGSGIWLAGSGTVSNNGSISGQHALLLSAGGSVTNNSSGVIVANTGTNATGVFIKNQFGTLSNSGQISGTGTGGTGVYIENNGSVTNTQGAAISGTQYGVFLEGGAGTVENSGTISGVDGIVLGLGGDVTNAAGAVITGTNNGVYAKYRATATITNSGSISGTGTAAAGIDIANGGSVVNQTGGSISGTAVGVFAGGSGPVVNGATVTNTGTITNSGTISGAHGVALLAGGTVTNNAGSAILGQSAGVFDQDVAAGVINSGDIAASAAGGAAIDLEAGGTITNNSGGSLSGSQYGVFINNGGTVSTGGTISGGSYAIKFTGTNTVNRVIVQPGAIFSGGAGGASAASNTLEFAGGSGTLNGVSGGTGTITPTGQTAWSFYHFDTIAIDSGGSMTFSGADNVSVIANNGTIGVAGSLDISTDIDPASSGIFNLASGAALEVAKALGSGTQMAFVSNSTLAIDDFTSFGLNVGTSSYAGPLLESFGAGDQIDLKAFGTAGANLSYDSSSGILQMFNGAQQASLLFQDSSLGSGGFFAASDGGAGTLLTRHT